VTCTAWQGKAGRLDKRAMEVQHMAKPDQWHEPSNVDSGHTATRLQATRCSQHCPSSNNVSPYQARQLMQLRQSAGGCPLKVVPRLPHQAQVSQASECRQRSGHVRSIDIQPRQRAVQVGQHVQDLVACVSVGEELQACQPRQLRDLRQQIGLKFGLRNG